MDIQQVITKNTFHLKASRNDLEALKAALHRMYHYQHVHIPEHLKSITSYLMDTVDEAIRKDDDIQRRVSSK